MTKKTVKPSKHAAQQRYAAGKAAAGEHLQFNVKIKTEADRKMMERLQKRFPKEKAPGIARIALRELDAKRN